MVNIDMERAKNLLKSAEDLHEQGDLAGVAGLAYAAFESAIMSLTDKINGKDYHSHRLRKERAKEMLSKHEDKMDFLWEVRNIDFYGNVKLGSSKREISPQEVENGLKCVKEIIVEIETIINEES
ncbi:HEPN domain-containing protein [Methanobacterium sp.]|uniref:HEPN domain-containing protein n=1 Tax=Methanobacterium sp. TaxID=2164 RepID=UPI0025E9AE2A|nr:HEPN domain-containing protein [Methanobacterium sp.]MBI5459226.1 HEPN domain-containing protein [Methanobacterium sp.]